MDIASLHYGQHRVPEWRWNVPAGGHPGFTLWSVWGGTGHIMLGKNGYKLNVGDVFLINYEKEVDAYQDDLAILDVRYIDFTLRNPDSLRDLPEHRHFDQYHFVLELFHRFRLAKESNHSSQMKIWLEALLSEYRDKPPAPASAYSIKIEELCRMFQQHPQEQYDISELARSYSLTPDHFIRIFKQERGVTPYAYLQRCRLETAKTLLRMSALSITDIANHCGFSDIYNFSRFFQSKTGCSPRKFRN
ncbi:helix-turn-helix transcriptional regulator [Paenibacillus arenilitoris]|uniref:Helix-turn-helix transcriptional regulator n=1 Tax=Paenibacillus arenilitoris TaxID=2772299 RepID=A0A927HA59_9BACL|nr:AraC family transcriptional regulator [Paenibacillus arenilitoris]MBD2872299.1 helix-turn-helix transcriptional regulator [Paenibacillus arenilitoris]